ncbi:MAG TPA: MaoC family dehydratase [Solirubrobacteraceae bacterium]|nr:MaoC family dehydratase [Solirubrobacteraceae bacterium]
MDSHVADGLTIDLGGLPALVGARLGPTAWAEMTQAQVNQFADLTGDHNFIHVDPERARESQFGGTIAHGFLTLSLVAPVTQLLTVTDAKASINYGMDKVRFPAPLPVGKRWRAVAEILEVAEVKGGVQARVAASVEVEGGERPVVAAEVLLRYLS